MKSALDPSRTLARILVSLTFGVVALATVPRAQTTRTFDGSFDDRWEVAENWTPTGVPTAVDDAVVPTGMSVIVGDGTCRNLTLESGAAIGGTSITCSGSATLSGEAILDALTCGAATISAFAQIQYLTVGDRLDLNADFSGQSIHFTGPATFTVGEVSCGVNDITIDVSLSLLASGSGPAEFPGAVRVTGGPLTWGGLLSFPQGASIAPELLIGDDTTQVDIFDGSIEVFPVQVSETIGARIRFATSTDLRLGNLQPTSGTVEFDSVDAALLSATSFHRIEWTGNNEIDDDVVTEEGALIDGRTTLFGALRCSGPLTIDPFTTLDNGSAASFVDGTMTVGGTLELDRDFAFRDDVRVTGNVTSDGGALVFGGQQDDRARVQGGRIQRLSIDRGTVTLDDTEICTLTYGGTAAVRISGTVRAFDILPIAGSGGEQSLTGGPNDRLIVESMLVTAGRFDEPPGTIEIDRQMVIGSTTTFTPTRGVVRFKSGATMFTPDGAPANPRFNRVIVDSGATVQTSAGPNNDTPIVGARQLDVRGVSQTASAASLQLRMQTPIPEAAALATPTPASLDIVRIGPQARLELTRPAFGDLDVRIESLSIEAGGALCVPEDCDLTVEDSLYLGPGASIRFGASGDAPGSLRAGPLCVTRFAGSLAEPVRIEGGGITCSFDGRLLGQHFDIGTLAGPGVTLEPGARILGDTFRDAVLRTQPFGTPGALVTNRTSRPTALRGWELLESSGSDPWVNVAQQTSAPLAMVQATGLNDPARASGMTQAVHWVSAKTAVERIEIRPLVGNFMRVRFETSTEAAAAFRLVRCGSPEQVVATIAAQGTASTHELVDDAPPTSSAVKYRLQEDVAGSWIDLDVLTSASKVVLDGPVTRAGPGGYPTIQSAVDATPTGGTVLVDPGIYAPFTLDRPMSILGMEEGVVVEAFDAPILVRGADGSTHSTLAGLAVHCAAGQPGLVVEPGARLAVLECLRFDGPPGFEAFRVTDRPDLLIQSVEARGVASLTGSMPTVLASEFRELSLDGSSVLEAGSVWDDLATAASTIDRRPQGVPLLEVPVVWRYGTTVDGRVLDGGWTNWLILFSTERNRVDLGPAFPFDLPLLVDSSNLLVLVTSEDDTVTDSGAFEFVMPSLPAGIGDRYALQVVGFDNPFSGRFGGATDVFLDD